jgi:DNA modification methylase
LVRFEHQDCLKFISTITSDSVDLVILDPPYNVGAASWDKVSDYLDWMKSVLSECRRVLKDNGSMYLWGTSRNNDFLRLKLWMDDNINLEFKNWIVWVHKVKLHRKLKDRFLSKHEDLLFYAGRNNTFNVVRDEPPEFQLKMHAGRHDENFFVPVEKLPPSQQKIFKNGLQMGSPAKSWRWFWRRPRFWSSKFWRQREIRW